MRYCKSSFVLVLAMQAAHAAPDKTLYELKAQCGEQVSTYFKHEFGSGVQDKNVIYGYQAHYNAKLNACIYTLSTFGWNKDAILSMASTFRLRTGDA